MRATFRNFRSFAPVAATGLLLTLAGTGCAGISGKGGERGSVVELEGPAVLDRPGTEYVLVRDVTAEGTAFTVTASHVTLNLNGRRVRYGSQEGKGYGVEVPGHHLRDIRIVGGEIVQAPESGCRGDANARGCNPVYIPFDARQVEIADLRIAYHTPNTAGIHMHWAKEAVVRGNRIEDRGETVENRHQGVAAVENTRGRGLTALGNEILRTRQLGIRTGEDADIRDNVIGIESVATNSTGIAVKSGTIRGNRIVGRGVHPIGIWPGSRTRVEGNYVNVRSTRLGEEYGSTGAACLRMTWGNDDVEVTDNLFVLEAAEAGREGEATGWGRALWVGLPHEGEKALFARNLIVANNRRGEAKAAAIAVVCNNASPGLVFEDNTVISNWGNVLLADDYGHADGFPRFAGNTFVRQDDFSGYRTIRSEYPGRPSTGVFIDNLFLNGAGADKIDLPYNAEGVKELRFGRTVRVEVADAHGRPVSDAAVEIAARSGEVVYSGKTDAGGRAEAQILEYRLVRPPGVKSSDGPATGRELLRQEEGPFTVTVEKGGTRVSRPLPAETAGSALTVRLDPSRREARRGE